MGGTASERSSGHCARLWTSVGHWRDGKNLERHTSDVGAHMAPLGVETAGRACYSINNTTFAMYSERDSLRRPWAHVGRSARSARIGSVVMGGVCVTGDTRGGKGLRLNPFRTTFFFWRHRGRGWRFHPAELAKRAAAPEMPESPPRKK